MIVSKSIANHENIFLLTIILILGLFPAVTTAENTGIGLRASAFLSLGTAAESITELQRLLASNPDNVDIKFRLARAYNISREFDKSIPLFEELLRADTENADYFLGIGQAYLWSDRPSAAVIYLEKAASLDPDYEDVHRTLALAYTNNGQQKEAEKVYASSISRFNNPAWATSGKRALESSKMSPDLRFVIDNRYEDLNYNPDDWRDTRIMLITDLADRKNISFFYINSDRFGETDHTYGAMGYFPLTDKTTLHAELAYSHTHEVLPEYTAYLQLGQAFYEGWGLLGGIRMRDYTEDTVYTGDITLEKYISDFRAAYTAYISDSDAGTAWSHRIQFGYFFSAENNIQIAFSTGTEVEKTLNANTILETDFNDISLWGEYWLTQTLGLKYGAGFTDLDLPNQRDGNRKSIYIGIEQHF